MDDLDLGSLIQKLTPDQARKLGVWMQENNIAHPKEYVLSPLHCWEITSETADNTLVLVSGPLSAALGEVALRVSKKEQKRIRDKVCEMIGQQEE